MSHANDGEELSEGAELGEEAEMGEEGEEAELGEGAEETELSEEATNSGSSEEAEVDDTWVDALIAEARELTKVQKDLLKSHPFPFDYQSYSVKHICASPRQPNRGLVVDAWMATTIHT